MEFFISLITGVITGLIASYIFLVYYLNSKRPKIEISKYISNVIIDGEENFMFKFINKTKVEIFDVQVELTFHKPIGDVKGKNLRGTDIILKDNFISYIPPKSKNDIYNLHAMRIRTTEKILDLWSDESSFIRLTIISKHSLSGFNKVFVHDFNSKECITNKKFQSGDDLEVN